MNFINLRYDGGGGSKCPSIFICENNRKSNKIMHCVGCEDRDILWAFFTNLSIESIYLSLELREKWPYLKTTIQKKIKQCIILLLFRLFSQIKIGVTLWAPLPIITKIYLPLIITKVKCWTNIQQIECLPRLVSGGSRREVDRTPRDTGQGPRGL